MAFKKHNDNLFTNEDTLVRRAWIETAIESVRSRMDAPMPQPESGDLGRLDFESAGTDEMEATGPHLVLAWSADERRSGT